MLLKTSTFLPGPGPLIQAPRENIVTPTATQTIRLLASLGIGS